MIRPRKLSVQLIVWFSAIALVPLSIVTISTYLASKSALHDQVTTGLFAMASRQSNQLATYVREREQNVATLSRMPGAINALDDLRRATDGRESGPALDILDRQYRPFLSYYQEAFGYDDLALVLPDGRVAFSAQRRIPVGANLRADPYRTTGLGVAFDRIRTLLEIDISDFAPSGEGDVAAYLGAPVLGNNRFLGVVLVRLNTSEIVKILSDHTGLGETGETLLNRRIDGNAVIMVPLRRSPDPPFTRRVALGSASGIPEQLSVQGSRGEGVSIDHQNRPVLAVWRYVPALGAGLVVKIDADEAYAPIRNLTLLAIILAGMTVALVVVAARSLARSISDPVVALTAATSRIAEGDLTRRVELTATNEIGQLAGSFNRMTERLAQSIEELTQTTAAKERIESELRVAHDIQMGILPKIFPPFPQRPEFDLHALIHPAREVGGDFYDFFLFGEDELYFVIGDVAGKGVPASLFMAVTLTLFRSSLVWGLDPAALLRKLNQHLCADNDSCLFVTMFCGKLHVPSGEVIYSNGGHNSPYVLRCHGSLEPLPRVGGPALGLSDRATYRLGRLTLQPQDALILYTDGVTEATSPDEEFFLESRLEACLRTAPGETARQLVECVSRAVEEFTAGAPPADDITLVTLRYCGSADGSREDAS